MTAHSFFQTFAECVEESEPGTEPDETTRRILADALDRVVRWGQQAV